MDMKEFESLFMEEPDTVYESIQNIGKYLSPEINELFVSEVDTALKVGDKHSLNLLLFIAKINEGIENKING